MSRINWLGAIGLSVIMTAAVCWIYSAAYGHVPRGLIGWWLICGVVGGAIGDLRRSNASQ